MAMTVFWVAMVVISVLCGLMTGHLPQVSQAAAEGAQSAVTLCLSMAGMLCLWSGVLEVMNRSGLTQKLRTLLLPVLEIYGTSMKPNLTEGDIVVSVKSSSLETGDVIAFYYNNRVLVKRVIATGGESVYIDAAGNVSVNGTLLDEPYLAEKDAGISDLDYPYVVPAGTYFVLGDHRESSVDSRSSLVGCVEQSEVVGKIIFRVWPLSSFGKIK